MSWKGECPDIVWARLYFRAIIVDKAGPLGFGRCVAFSFAVYAPAVLLPV
jgi:hypothetical protein